MLLAAGVAVGLLLAGASVYAQVGEPKNLQVLKGKSSKEVRDYMKTVADGLGQKCNYCHNLKDYSSDELKPKKVAREFLKMVQSINTQVATINKNVMAKSKLEEVTCYTCHQGSLEIVTAAK
jgi:hypothetical protein